MSVSTDIVRTWRRPRSVIRDLLDQGRREDRAIVFLMISCFLIFVAQWPRLRRVSEGYETSPFPPEMNFEGMMTYTFFGTVIVLPLMMYGIAAFSHLVAKLFGGKGSWFGARLALFWTLLATSPLFLFYGLVRGLIGPGTQAQVVGWIGALIFVYIWVQSLREAESGT
ncbi:Yip1 family protein [Yoonia litorea]|uniref:Yip1 domain-containing protein n=1 Tax=Yoonia litorea TaxID=1123755 RepID=A0A1I6M188_9RHOB|nr:Yip1 family protein [Yoonia litorea]SFS09252.1 Yip1 domain-containing protein [Yoonia litorea]